MLEQEDIELQTTTRVIVKEPEHGMVSPEEEEEQVPSDPEEELVPDTIPNHLLCPITKEVMKFPVFLADGHTYDYEAIRGWLTTRNTSPMTNTSLPTKWMMPNLTVKGLIEEHLGVSIERVDIVQIQGAVPPIGNPTAGRARVARAVAQAPILELSPQQVMRMKMSIHQLLNCPTFLVEVSKAGLKCILGELQVVLPLSRSKDFMLGAINENYPDTESDDLRVLVRTRDFLNEVSVLGLSMLASTINVVLPADWDKKFVKHDKINWLIDHLPINAIVIHPMGNFMITVNKKTSIDTIHAKISHRYGHLELLDDTQLLDGTLSSHNPSDGMIIKFVPNSQSVVASLSSSSQEILYDSTPIPIVSLHGHDSGTKTFLGRLNLNMFVWDFKVLVEAKTAVIVANQRLSFSGHQMHDDKKLGFYGVANESTIKLVDGGLLGGAGKRGRVAEEEEVFAPLLFVPTPLESDIPLFLDCLATHKFDIAEWVNKLELAQIEELDGIVVGQNKTGHLNVLCKPYTKFIDNYNAIQVQHLKWITQTKVDHLNHLKWTT